jgi:callose synthase
VSASDDKGSPIVKNEFYSVLVKAEPDASGKHVVREVYRVKLPGNPIVGEGKPENQNHAIIFTRGEYLQTIDMNQENYMEEALKIKNLLEEFDGHEQPSILVR